MEYVIKDVSEISQKDYESSFLYMSDNRKAKVERQKNRLSKQCTLAGEWLVRTLLCKLTGDPMESFVIDADSKGKLYCKNADGLKFNISHSQSTVAVVVSQKEVGIDIETIRPLNLKLAQKICTHEELEYVFEHTPSDEDFEQSTNIDYVRRFLEIWTLKEAYLKCEGTGITGFDAFILPDKNFEKTKISNSKYVMHIVTK